MATENLNLKTPQKGFIRNAFDNINYHWSNLTWRIGVLGIPAFLLLGNPAGAGVAGFAYLLDRNSIRNYKQERGIPLEQGQGLWDFLNPHKKGSLRFYHSSRLAAT